MYNTAIYKSSHKNLINYGCTKKCNAGGCKSFETTGEGPYVLEVLEDVSAAHSINTSR